ncbi:MAG: tetratricopeptide repeat protein [Firmicutes bacterium]|nr:tetratricopeptide repeat protein [Bacillota bacterium]MCM1402027.1 tetratricopeptide repeat protein [Bacteroides sp.]MCM1477956.1 tetratricopeptide repeat protein [Bacteroides sp.]
MPNFDDITTLVAAEEFDKAIEALKKALAEDGDNAEAWYLLGKAYWRKGERSEAMSCYAKSVALDPDSPAGYALEQARDIANFFNPDLLNP